MMKNLSVETGKSGVEQAARASRPWILLLARFGYAAKGIVYLIIGGLAALAATSSNGGKTAGPHGALAELFHQPFGQILLVVLIVGLVGYAVWRFTQLIVNPENKNLGGRLLYSVFGFIYAGLAISAVNLLLGSGKEAAKDEAAPREWTATLMEQPFGQFLVAAVGVGIIAYAVSQFFHAYSTKFREKLDTREMSEFAETSVTRIAQIGIAARAVVFVIMGIFLVLAAWHHNPNEARGLSGALSALGEQPFGALILWLIAVGLMAYGIYQLIEARYRRFEL